MLGRTRGRTRARMWPLDPRISKREGCIAILVWQGLTDGEIGERLHISKWTVKAHMIHIFNKTFTNNRIELAGHVGFLLGRMVELKHAFRDTKRAIRVLNEGRKSI